MDFLPQKRFLFFTVCIVLSLLVLSASALSNEDDWERLEKGEVLVTDAVVKGLDNENHLMGKAVALVDAPPLKVWKTIMDHDHFAEFMPSVEKCSIKEDLGKSRLVAYYVKILWMDITYHLRLIYNQENWHVDFYLDKEFHHDIADTQGTWDLQPISGGTRTKVTYSVFIDSGQFIPGFVERYLSKRQLPEVVRNVRNRVLSGGTWKKGDPEPTKKK